jgi:hypothetical protein
VAAAALVVPQVLDVPQELDEPPGQQVAQEQVVAPADVPVLTEPTRGSLAGDTAFVEAARRADWGPLTPPPVPSATSSSPPTRRTAGSSCSRARSTATCAACGSPARQAARSTS